MSGYSLSHELGHNMGCSHDRAVKAHCDTNEYGDYFYGYVDPKARWVTIMSYTNRQTGTSCNGKGRGRARILRFANYDDDDKTAYNYEGHPTGTRFDKCGQNINDNAAMIASYREAVYVSPPTLAPSLAPTREPTLAPSLAPTRAPTRKWNELFQEKFTNGFGNFQGFSGAYINGASKLILRKQAYADMISGYDIGEYKKVEITFLFQTKNYWSSNIAFILGFSVGGSGFNWLKTYKMGETRTEGKNKAKLTRNNVWYKARAVYFVPKNMDPSDATDFKFRIRARGQTQKQRVMIKDINVRGFG